MTDKELEEVMEPALNALKYVHYDEAVVIGSVLGQLSSEIKRLRDGKEVIGPLVYPEGIED